MDYPLRSVIDCVHEGQNLGSVVVIRGKAIYDDDGKITGYNKKFMQIRRGNLKGKDCREFFDSILQWNQSFGLYNIPDAPEQPNPLNTCISILILLPLTIMYGHFVAYMCTH